ncbi:MAG: hypothetical protein HFJ35_00155 [Clostridia bacterium]|nr:hypothetical protein [Clostridia bacterium]
MRIEISNHSKTNLTNNERDRIYELTNECIDAYYLISEKNNGALVILECVPKKCTEKITKLLGNKYEITVTEDSFMAQIDLIDMLSGGLW